MDEEGGYARMSDTTSSSFVHDYGDTDDNDDFFLNMARPTVKTESSPVASKAKEISSSIQNKASSLLKSTKDWLASKQAPERVEPKKLNLFGYDESAYDHLISYQRQRELPVCVGTILQQSDHKALYRSLTLKVPMDAITEFVAALPNGENRIVDIPESGLKPGGGVEVLFQGICRDDFAETFSDDASSDRARKSPEDRLLDLYRCHNPEDREAVLSYLKPFTVSFFEGEFGAHVLYATYVGSPSMIMVDDIITSLNGESVNTALELQSKLDFLVPDDFVCLGILRKSPPPVQHCPQGHELQVFGPLDPLAFGSECHRCAKPLADVSRVYRCHECDWNICNACYEFAYEAMNSGLNANKPEPEWAADYQEAFGKSLTFSVFDKGSKIRIFWHTTGAWWLGEITNYDRERGHEIVYEEGIGQQKRFSKQLIANISLFTYKVLKKKDPSMEKLALSNEEEIFLEGIEANLIN